MRKTEESRSGVEVAIEFHLECPTFQIYVYATTTTWPTAMRTINKALHRTLGGTRQRDMRDGESKGVRKPKIASQQ